MAARELGGRHGLARLDAGGIHIDGGVVPALIEDCIVGRAGDVPGASAAHQTADQGTAQAEGHNFTGHAAFFPGRLGGLGAGIPGVAVYVELGGLYGIGVRSVGLRTKFLIVKHSARSFEGFSLRLLGYPKNMSKA